MQEKPIIDIVALGTVLAALLFSSEVAAVVGPYMVIIAGAMLGASFALARRDRSKRPSAVFFMARIAGLAALITVSLAEFINAYRPEWPVRVLLAPIALLVGFVGDDWPSVLSKVVRKALAAIDLLRGLKDGDTKGGDT